MPDTPPSSPPASDQSPRPTLALPAVSPWRRLIHLIGKREQIMNALRSLAWVVPLTLVIWIYAEREQITTVSGIQAAFEIKSKDPRYVVTLKQDRNLELELTGPRAQVDDVARRLRPGGNVTSPIVISVDTRSVGELPLNTYDQIYNQPIFVNSGVSVEKDKCLPKTLFVDVDELEERDVMVQVPAALKDVFDGPATFDPPTVKVKAPKSAFERALAASSDHTLAVYAAIGGLDVLKQPGHHEIASVAINWPIPNEANVSISPDAVKAIFNVKQADVTYEIPSVPVYLVTPFGLLDQNHVQYSPTIKNVKVIGPADRIDELKRDDSKVSVRGLLTITNSDPVGSDTSTSRTLRYDLPDGVRISDDDAKRQVTFTLIARTAGP